MHGSIFHSFILHLIQNLHKLCLILSFQTSLAEDSAASQIWCKGYAVSFLLHVSRPLKQQTCLVKSLLNLILHVT